MLKVDSSRQRMLDINPDIQVDTYNEAFTSTNARRIAKDYDLIIDGTDNFPTRYLINEKIQKPGIPFIYGGVLGLMGMVTLVRPGSGPCLKCLFPQAPPPKKFPVLGTTPGIIGVIEAHEAIKYLTGIGEILAGRLLVFNGQEMKFSEIVIEKNPECEVCSR